jgi:O-methyltransferase domain
MGEKGRVLLVDRVVPDTNAMSFIKLLDLNMLAMTGGRERTKAEFRALLDAAVTSWRESFQQWLRRASLKPRQEYAINRQKRTLASTGNRGPEVW